MNMRVMIEPEQVREKIVLRRRVASQSQELCQACTVAAPAGRVNGLAAMAAVMVVLLPCFAHGAVYSGLQGALGNPRSIAKCNGLRVFGERLLPKMFTLMPLQTAWNQG